MEYTEVARTRCFCIPLLLPREAKSNEQSHCVVLSWGLIEIQKESRKGKGSGFAIGKVVVHVALCMVSAANVHFPFPVVRRLNHAIELAGRKSRFKSICRCPPLEPSAPNLLQHSARLLCTVSPFSSVVLWIVGRPLVGTYILALCTLKDLIPCIVLRRI
jgi:hypothetical protein